MVGILLNRVVMTALRGMKGADRMSSTDIYMKDVGGTGNCSAKTLMWAGLSMVYRKGRNVKKQGKFFFQF